MGYPVGLDEMDEPRLHQEIDRRKQLRHSGLCDYCERNSETTVCKFPKRHYAFHATAKSIRDLLRKMPLASPEDMEKQRRSFVFGNVSLSNPDVTREMVDAIADEMAKRDKKAEKLH